MALPGENPYHRVVWAATAGKRGMQLLAKKKRERRRAIPPNEGRASEAITVIWMMSVVTTVVCGIVALAVLLAAGDQPGADQPRLFGRLLHFAAFVTATVSLLLLGLVLKFRAQPPPPAITWFAVIVALAVIGATFL